MFRIGHGYDTHGFESGKPLILGGVRIPHQLGLKAHSDGDVVIHAICDALLGAAALGDIGQHFPDNDERFSNMDSRLFLRHIFELISHKQYHINNIDVTVLAEAPKLSPFIVTMRENLAKELLLSVDAINIKATTTEKMGFVGRQEGIACYAIALLEKKECYAKS